MSKTTLWNRHYAVKCGTGSHGTIVVVKFRHCTWMREGSYGESRNPEIGALYSDVVLRAARSNSLPHNHNAVHD